MDVPDFVSDRAALAVATQGFTAWHMLRTMARITRWGHRRGDGRRRWRRVDRRATRQGVGGPPGDRRGVHLRRSARSAAALGADVTVDSTSTDIGAALVEANGGRMVDIILEMHGGPQLDSALAALAPAGGW